MLEKKACSVWCSLFGFAVSFAVLTGLAVTTLVVLAWAVGDVITP